MCARIEAAVRPNQGSRSDSDRARIDESRIPIQLCALPEDDMEPVVRTNGVANPRFFVE